jgi:5-methylcytosine-specific restriction endonuclease McrA
MPPAHPQANVLLLNVNYDPLKVVTWERATLLLLEGRAELVEAYAGRLIRSVSQSMPWPAVIRLTEYVRQRTRIRFNRQNVLARDGYKCAYCGVAPKTKQGTPRLEDLTLDHVIPRAQSRNAQVRMYRTGKVVNVTCWENIVCACVDCNIRKADRDPDQAGMRLLVQPRAPTSVDVLRMHLRKARIPQEWVSYLPDGAKEWASYWTEELEPG